MHDCFDVALAPTPTPWPPDDTEASVLGTSLHQTAIRLRLTGINEAVVLRWTTPRTTPTAPFPPCSDDGG